MSGRITFRQTALGLITLFPFTLETMEFRASKEGKIEPFIMATL